jgi:hypothetical protein
LLGKTALVLVSVTKLSVSSIIFDDDIAISLITKRCYAVGKNGMWGRQEGGLGRQNEV